jgi:hypothetical protein
MKEYIYEVEHSWEKQREPVVVDHQHQHHHHHRQRSSGDDADASSMSGKYKHLYSVASLYVHLKLRNKKNDQSFAGIHLSIVLLLFAIHIYKLIINLLY